MKINKLKVILVSSAIFTGAILDNSVMALAEDTKRNVDVPQDKTAVTQQANEKTAMIINGIRVNKQLININYSKGVTIVPKYIVIHDTDNRAPGATAMANRNYFANHPEANASAHYIVDDSNIVQALEDTWKGWHVGDGGYSATVQNGNSIGIELAVNSGGNFDKTYETGIELTRYLMKKYNIPAQNVVMHNHASGKICSKMMIVDRPNMWEEFKEKVAEGMPGESLINDGIKPIAKGKLTNVSSYLSLRTQPNTTSAILGNVYPNKIMNIYGEENGYYKVDFMGTRKTYGYVNKKYIKIIDGDIDDDNKEENDNEDRIEINKDGIVVNLGSVSALNVRTGAGTNHNIQDRLPLNTKVKVNYKTENGWYNISYSGKTGFVSGNYIKIVEAQKPEKPEYTNTTPVNKDGLVVNLGSVSALNVRTGAGTNHNIQDRLPLNTKVRVNYKTQNGWYNISYSGKTGYVSGNYIKIVEVQKPEKPEHTNTTPVNKDGVVTNLGSVSALNVRTGAGTNHNIQDRLPLNTKVRVNYKTKNGWYNISYSGKIGFVSGDYIKIVEAQKPEKPEHTNTTPVNKDGLVVNLGKVSALNVRTGSGTNHSIKDRLPLNTKVKVNYKTKNGWYNISYSGKTGFVSGDYIKILQDNETVKPDTGNINRNGKVINVLSSLNVRTGPSTSYSIKDRIKGNKIVKVNYEKNGWYNISYDGKIGYVSASYIEII